MNKMDELILGGRPMLIGDKTMAIIRKLSLERTSVAAQRADLISALGKLRVLSETTNSSSEKSECDRLIGVLQTLTEA